jgi:hypothetical protein
LIKKITNDNTQTSGSGGWNKWFEYLGILFNLAIAGQFLWLWILPDASDINKIVSFSALILFEFVMVHSGIFMTAMPLKLSLFVFFPFYGLFAWGFNQMVSDNSILILYLVVVFNRMRFAFFNVDKNEMGQLVLKSILSAALYFVLIFLVVLTAGIIPRFGLSEEFLSKSMFAEIKQGSGLMIDLPHTSMCMGFLYYTFLAIIEFKLIRKSQKSIQTNQ